MKLLLLAIIIGAVVLLSYFGEPVSPQPARLFRALPRLLLSE